MDSATVVPEARRQLVVVLGMHRSGTSALTRGVQAVGVDLGKNLLPGVPGNNDKGFFEDIDVYALNDALLAAAGAEWDSIRLSSMSSIEPAVLRSLELRGISVLEERSISASRLAVKDPRFCRLLPFWQPLFRQLSLDVSYLLALRDPVSVARSLARRDGMSIDRALCLWTVYTVSALQHLQHERFMVVDFETLLGEAGEQLRRVAGFLGIEEGAIDSRAMREFEAGFLDKGMRHFRENDGGLAKDPRIPALTRDVYTLLKGLAGDRIGESQLSAGDLSLLQVRLDDMLAGFALGDGEASGPGVGRSERASPRLPRGIATEFTVYFATGEQHFIEAMTSKATLVIGGGRQRVCVRIPRGCDRVRIDPAQHPCLARFHNSRMLGKGARLLDEFVVRHDRIGQPAGIVVRADQGLAQPLEFVCTGEDPQFTLTLSEPVLDALEEGDVEFHAELELEALATEVSLSIDDLREIAESGARSVLAVHRSNEELQFLRAQIERFPSELRVELAAVRSDYDRVAADLRDQISAVRSDYVRSVAELREQSAQEMAALASARASLQQRVGELEQSTSWRLTAPLRAATTGLRVMRHRVHGLGSQAVRAAYRRAPVRMEAKLRLKTVLFSRWPALFSGTRAFEDWERHTGRMIKASVPAPVAQRASQVSLGGQRLTAVERDESFVGEPRISPDARPVVTAVAFYLPQFHPCPENDAWWGKGFTEWTNVSRALPRFDGHYQPHLPGELGFYDLRVQEVLARQVELAKIYGIGAFCFYFYWFDGRTLLEMPVRDYLARKELDLPFCLCWANENWSRRWDGLDSEVLIAQRHSAEDDLAFFAHIADYLRDSRYLRVEGRPVLLVYRPELLPDPLATARRWREAARESGIPEPYLVYPQSFERVDPAVYGFDAAVEFPPNLSDPPRVEVKAADPSVAFNGIVYDWQSLVDRSERYEVPGYTLFRGVCPSWDNEPRRSGRGAVFVNSSPAQYERWLRNAVRDTCARLTDADHRLVFINAWNEWAEGAHLEPDARYGYAWLEATRKAVTSAVESSRRIVVVTHDAYPHGAQLLALNMVRQFASALRFEVATVCLGDGPLKQEFARYGAFHDLAGVDHGGTEAQDLASSLRARGFEAAIVNSTVSGSFVGALSRAGLRSVALVHELPGVLRDFALQAQAAAIVHHADAIVFPAERVRDGFCEFAACESARFHVRPQGLYKRNRYLAQDGPKARQLLRDSLGLPSDAFVVLGVGFADRRKGVDLFVEAGLRAACVEPRLHFVWVGHWDAPARQHVDALIREAPGLEGRFHFEGLREETDLYYAGADLFALTSREDPFPTVVLEAMEVGLPVVAFEGGGGYEALVREACGIVVQMESTPDLEVAFVQAAQQPGLLADAREAGPRLVRDRYCFRKYLFDLLDLAGLSQRRVSVIVPNYNYARFIEARLDSVNSQTRPLYELIVLDDCSTDASVDLIRKWTGNSAPDAVVAVNEANSGNVFSQWAKGVALASGDYIWIAEADDLCDPEFLAGVLPAFDDPDVVLSYGESRQMSGDGVILCNDYRDYVRDISTSRWSASYVREGLEEIREALCIKNTIPNVSAVVFRRDRLSEALEAEAARLGTLKVAGDWLVYLRVLEKGRIAYSPVSRNSHRRHSDGVTLSSFNRGQLREIEEMQELAAKRFDLPPVSRDAAQRYAQHLCRQFGLAGESTQGARDADAPTPSVAVGRVLDRAEELSRGGSVPKVLDALRGLSLRDFGELMISLPRNDYPGLSSLLPRMADAQVQRDWTGSSGMTLLRQSHAFVEAVRKRYERLSGRELGEASVLDYGCGYGRLLRLMLYFCDPDRLYGCDPWERSIELCRECALPARLSVSDYLPLSLPFAPDSMDFAYAFSVFTHTSLRATSAALLALRGVLKPDGILVITIRPVEYWHVDPAVDEQERAGLTRKHEAEGFAFRPHNRQAVDGDVTYGDTSISLERLAELAEGWTILESEIQADDPYQRLVYLRRCSG